MRIRSLLALVAVVACTCTPEPPPPPPIEQPVPLYTPSWAFEPWISKDISDGADTRAFLEGFRERDIPVGVVVLDSPWETNYNTFIPNEARYPDFAQMVQDFRDDDVRTILWTTQMVNESSFDVEQDRKSTRLNSSHSQISYAVFCLKKKKKKKKKKQNNKRRK